MVHSFGNPYYLLLIAAATEIRQALGRGMRHGPRLGLSGGRAG